MKMSRLLLSLAAVALFTVQCCVASTGFSIQLEFTTAVESTVQTQLQTAAARWTEIIIKGFGSTFTLAPGTAICNQNISSTIAVKDLIVFVSVEPLDGPLNNLVRTGPCAFDSQNNVRASQMQIDSADLPNLLASGQFQSVATHEMGHALGVGTVWDRRNLLLDAPAQGLILMQGANAGAGQGEIGAPGIPEVDTSPVTGVGRIHWLKSLYGNELMTATISGSAQPLSALTARSLADIGYTIDVTKADPFTIPPEGTTQAPVVPPPTEAPTSPTLPPPTNAPTTPPPTKPPTSPPPGITSAPVATSSPTTAAPVSSSTVVVSDATRIAFLTENAASLNNAAIVSATNPLIIPNNRVLTAAEGCAIQGNGFICTDLARNVRCVNGLVAINDVNPFSANHNMKACVGGFCGGTNGNPVAGQNPCVATPQQAVDNNDAGFTFFLNPPVPPTRRALQTYFDAANITTDDGLNWEEGYYGVVTENLATTSPGSSTGAIVGGTFVALGFVGAAAMLAVRRRKSSTENKNQVAGRDSLTTANPMYSTSGARTNNTMTTGAYNGNNQYASNSYNQNAYGGSNQQQYNGQQYGQQYGNQQFYGNAQYQGGGYV